ncbi:MAG: M13 family metallopeptidase [bacterium]
MFNLISVAPSSHPRPRRRHPVALARLALAAGLLSWPPTRASAQATYGGGIRNPESAVSASVRPGDDFFSYVNGDWLKATNIPAGKERWGTRDALNAITRQRVLQLLDDARSAPHGSAARKVSDFRAALSNEAAIEANGPTALRPYLDSIVRLPDKAALARLLGREMRADVDPLNWAVYRSASVLGLSVEPSIHGEKNNVAFLVQGGLGLPDREHYVSGDTGMVVLRAKYRAYVARILGLAGVDHAEQRADAVLALEMAIAQTQATRAVSTNDHNADTLWTRAEFARQAPGLDWAAFFEAAGLATQESLVPWQPTAVRGLAALVASQPLQSWKDYLRVRALDTYADALPTAFASEASRLHAAAAGGEPPATSRAQRATSTTELALSDAIGRLYAERYFPAEQKTRLQAIAVNVVAACRRRVEAVTWMSPATRARALEKLNTLYVGIGYPERWTDYSELVVDPADAVGNLRRIADWNRRRALALLDTPVDMTKWWVAPQAVNGILVFQQNAYEISAALLQPPKFDPTASDAAAYGSIGAIISHDVLHFVDVLGAEYDVDGSMRHWWTPEDMQRFHAATEPLVKQFATYRPFPDVAIDGALTLTENVADLGGITAAFDAYRRTLGTRASDAAYVRQHDREFFLAFAQSSRIKNTDGAMRAQAATSDHAPETYRASTVRNLDAWYEAFDVQPGERLYLVPAARVRIW